MSDIKIERRIPSESDYLRLRSAVGWRNTPKEITASALRNSLFSVCVLDGEKVIGIGRVIGDCGLYYYIQDIIVLPQYQRKGIGSQIMDEVKSYLSNIAPKEAFIGLMAAKGLITFYEGYGFKVRDEDSPGMYVANYGFNL